MNVRQQPEGANASWKKFRWCTRLYQRVVFPQSCRRLALITSWSCPSARLSTARWTPAPLGKIVSSMSFGQPHSCLRVWKLSYIYRRQAFRQSNYYIILFRPYFQFHHRHLWFLSDIWSFLSHLTSSGSETEVAWRLCVDVIKSCTLYHSLRGGRGSSESWSCLNYSTQIAAVTAVLHSIVEYGHSSEAIKMFAIPWGNHATM